MKKQLLTLTLALAALTASAQENTYQLPDGYLAVEMQANPFSNDFSTFKMAGLKARLFLNDKHAVRFGIDLGFDNNKSDDKTSFDNRPEEDETYSFNQGNTVTTTKATAMKFSLGYEYHFAQTGRLDFYAGAELGYEMKRYSGKIEKTASGTRKYDTNNPYYGYGTPPAPNYVVHEYAENSVTEYKKMTPDQSRYNENSLVAGLFTGVDFYIYKGLYIGTELGISFSHGKEQNGTWSETVMRREITDGLTTSDWRSDFSSDSGITNYIDNLDSDNNHKTATNVLDHSATNNQLKIYVEPAIRFGWIF